MDKMINTNENEKLPFLNGEEIILKVKPMREKDVVDGIAICIIFMLLFVVISIFIIVGIAISPPIITSIFIVIWIGSFYFIYIGVKLYDEDLRVKRSTLYFTNTRIIENLGDGFYSHKIKYNEILFNYIDHFVVLDEEIWIFQKRTHGIPYYSGVETEPKAWAYTKNKLISLYGNEGLKTLDKIKNLLMKRIPAIQHPNLSDTFISKQK